MTAPENLEDPIVTIAALLADNWDDANTPSLGSAPKISTGWWSHDSDRPQVTVTNRDDSAALATETGWTGLAPGGLARDVLGQCLVQAWAARDQDRGGPDPRKVRAEMGREIQRILLANAQTPPGDLTFLGWEGPSDDEDRDEADRLVFRQIYTVVYGYELAA